MPSPARMFDAPLLVAMAGWLLAGSVQAGSVQVAIARLDCGAEPEPVNAAVFSDTFAYTDNKIQLTNSCYVVGHGDDFLLWDAGYAMDDKPTAPKRSLPSQLEQLGIAAEKVKFLGISHHHLDHTGQAAAFPQATLLIGNGDWRYVSAMTPPAGVDDDAFAQRRSRFQPWIDGGKVQPVSGDRDVFGDGSVVILNLGGHTPGHTGLLVRLKKTGNVLLSGDVTHFRENYAIDGIPAWNWDRADSATALARFKQAAINLKATVIIQHDPRDIDKLPAFPAAAR